MSLQSRITFEPSESIDNRQNFEIGQKYSRDFLTQKRPCDMFSFHSKAAHFPVFLSGTRKLKGNETYLWNRRSKAGGLWLVSKTFSVRLKNPFFKQMSFFPCDELWRRDSVTGCDPHGCDDYDVTLFHWNTDPVEALVVGSQKNHCLSPPWWSTSS